MKKLKSKKLDFLYFLYRLVSPIFDPIKFYKGISGYIWFARDLLKYKRMDRKAKLLNLNLYPSLLDKGSHPFDAHYFYQQIWVFEKVFAERPPLHVDVGSTYELSGCISKVLSTDFVDVRPIVVNLKNLNFVKADIRHLPYKDGSVPSLSCLHVVEHIGLGRYGDSIDPCADKKACEELSRILTKGGRLYFSVPIGRPRICFNSHRIYNPSEIVKTYFSGLKLTEFSAVDDSGKLITKCQPEDFKKAFYACGLYEFVKE